MIFCTASRTPTRLIVVAAAMGYILLEQTRRAKEAGQHQPRRGRQRLAAVGAAKLQNDDVAETRIYI
eukprot:scaffold6498_cov21-Prasinocladus_malaysianus.AAC.1